MCRSTDADPADSLRFDVKWGDGVETGPDDAGAGTDMADGGPPTGCEGRDCCRHRHLFTDSGSFTVEASVTDKHLEDQGGAIGALARTTRRFTVNGVSLAVEVRGEGRAVLLVHGYPLDRSIWSHQVAALDGFRRIAPDLRGMGASDAPDLGYSVETYAADLAALLDALGVDEAVLCGLSMGGYIAFEFLRRWRPPAGASLRFQGLQTRDQIPRTIGRYTPMPDEDDCLSLFGALGHRPLTSDVDRCRAL